MTKGSNPKLTLVDYRLAQARSEILSRVWGEDFEKTYNHSLLCSVNLPYRNPGDTRSLTVSSGAVSLYLEAGSLPARDGTWKPVGLPYGARARLLMLHLCSEAIRQRKPRVEVQKSFTAFAKDLGLSINGQSLRSLREQVTRMAAVRMGLSILHREGPPIPVFQNNLFTKLQGSFPADPNQEALWATHVEFNKYFLDSLAKPHIPLDKAAIAALKHSARALDIYCWLTTRLHKVDTRRPVKIKWTSLRYQFGTPEQKMGPFKRRFKEALEQVLFVYPQARVDVVYGGLKLDYSPPPVPKLDRMLG